MCKPSDRAGASPRSRSPPFLTPCGRRARHAEPRSTSPLTICVLTLLTIGLPLGGPCWSPRGCCRMGRWRQRSSLMVVRFVSSRGDANCKSGVRPAGSAPGCPDCKLPGSCAAGFASACDFDGRCRWRDRRKHIADAVPGRGADGGAISDPNASLLQPALDGNPNNPPRFRRPGDIVTAANQAPPTGSFVAPSRIGATPVYGSPSGFGAGNTGFDSTNRTKRKKQQVQVQAAAAATASTTQPETTFAAPPIDQPPPPKPPPQSAAPPPVLVYPARAAARPGAVLPPPAQPLQPLPVSNPPPEVHPLAATNRPGAVTPLPPPIDADI